MIDPYFSATKIAWILDHVPDARRRAEAGELAAGTVDSFLIWHLTGGRRFVTDATNASRTLLMDLRTLALGRRSLPTYSAFRAEYCPKSVPARENSARPRDCDFLPDGLPITGDRRRPAGVVDRPGLRRGRARPSAPMARAPSCWPTRAAGSCRRATG